MMIRERGVAAPSMTRPADTPTRAGPGWKVMTGSSSGDTSVSNSLVARRPGRESGQPNVIPSTGNQREQTMKLSYLYPLFGFIVPTVVFGYGLLIPRSCIAGINDLTIGFTVTLVCACVTTGSACGMRSETWHLPVPVPTHQMRSGT